MNNAHIDSVTPEALATILTSAVKACITDPATTGLQLSGGLDSAIIQAVAKLPNCYCCTWPEFDNISMARIAAQGADVKPVTFTKEEMIEEAIPDVARLTHGNGTWSQCCQWFMGRAMRADGMRVVLGGEGSDEYWGGYARYRIFWWLERLYSDPHLVEYQGAIDSLIGSRDDILLKHGQRLGRMWAVQRWDRPFSQVVAEHEQLLLEELICVEGIIARHHSLEHRWPFMDSAVLMAAKLCPEEWKITEIESKSILREAGEFLGVPIPILDEQTKRGLVVPPSWGTGKKWSRDWFTELMQAEWRKHQWNTKQDGTTKPTQTA